MKAQIYYAMDGDDSHELWMRELEEGFHMLRSFCPELYGDNKPKIPPVTAFRSLINGQFVEEQLLAVYLYAMDVVHRVEQKYASQGWEAEGTAHLDPELRQAFGASIAQAAASLKQAAESMLRWFLEQQERKADEARDVARQLRGRMIHAQITAEAVQS